MKTTTSLAPISFLIAASLALSACGSGGSAEPLPDAKTEINDSNLLDVFAIAAKARTDGMVFEQLPALISMQLLSSGNTPNGSSPCPGGGTMIYQTGSGSNAFSISFDKCKVNGLEFSAGSVQSLAVGSAGTDFDIIAKDLSINGSSDTLPLAPATYNANISRREGQNGQYSYSGNFSTLSKGKTDSIALSSLYERASLNTVLKQADATVTSSRFAQPLKLSSQAAQPLQLSISSKDGSTLIVVPKNDAYELTLRRSATATPLLTQLVSGGDLARALQSLY